MIDRMQFGSIMMNCGRYTENKTSGREQVNSFSGVLKSKSAASVDAAKTEETAGTEKVSLESMLKAKYPNLVYNVGDATSSAWRTRFGSFSGSGFNSMNSMLAMQSGQSAEREIHSMLQKGLKEKLGDTICGMPTDEVIDGTWADIEKGRSMRMSLMMI